MDNVLLQYPCPVIIVHMFTLSCCLTVLRSQDEAFSRITLSMGCHSLEMSEPSVTRARTLTCWLLPWLLGPLWPYRDCFPSSVIGLRYKLHRDRDTLFEIKKL